MSLGHLVLISSLADGIIVGRTLRGVGHHMLMIVGKVCLMKLMRTRAAQLGDDFVLKDFCDEVIATGQVPWSLIRWQIAGLRDDLDTAMS